MGAACLGLCVALLSVGSTLADEAGHTVILKDCAADPVKGVSVTYAPAENLFLAADGARYFASDLRFPERAADQSPPDARTVDAPAEEFSAIALGEPNRWGLIPAWIVTGRAGEAGLWQALQLEAGRAIFAPGHGEAACAQALRRAESHARRTGMGIWRQGGTVRIYSTDRPGPLEAAAGRYVIARGRIVSLGKTRRTRYLNFGKYWKTDVTGTLKTAEEDRFSAALGGAAGALDALAGRFVELRGVVELKDGPLITLRHPEQLVVLDD
ncbi:hypothetical protein [Roseibium sediminicola]|uniref:Nuclease homologue n=1 Tax=Roseibium sediminicola TaxID=2933272 RepID=A0ABT0GY15_9HYPH|nr:hypothetical protein [Roseibium sp. CAU 1639]MCK7614327.1 hypothetical protein [Roseibium sp. CAU 1639]